MKGFLILDGERRPFPVPPESQSFAVVPGVCPKCNAAPFRVSGTGKYIAADDRAYEAHGVCIDCKAAVGTIRVETDTLFGCTEDEAMLFGRPRVY